MAELRDPQNLLSRVTWDTRAAFRKLAQRSPWPVGVRSARRTCAEQRDLYGIGRTYNQSSPPVTYQPGCGSWHVLGRAVDADPLDPGTGKPLVGCDYYARLGALWEALGGTWGGRFPGFGACGDAGHFEWHAGRTLARSCPDQTAAGCAASEAAANAETADPPRLVPWSALAAGAMVGVAVAWAARRLD